MINFNLTPANKWRARVRLYVCSKTKERITLLVGHNKLRTSNPKKCQSTMKTSSHSRRNPSFIFDRK